MTAYTIGAKRRAKAAQKALQAAASVCPLSGVTIAAERRHEAAQADTEAMRRDLSRRCACMGWPADEKHTRIVRSDQRMGTLYGRLLLVGRLGRSEASAQDAYAGLMELDRLDRQYARIVLGRPVPNDSEGMAQHDEDAIKALASAWVLAQGALTALGHEVRTVTLDALEASPDTWPRDVSNADALRLGLAGLAMARHFRLRL